MTRVLVTRPAGQPEELTRALGRHGIESVHVPTVAIVPGDPSELAAAISTRPSLDWLVITSPNGAAAVLQALRLNGAAARSWRLAAIGPATASVLRSGGLAVDAMPRRFLTSEIAAAMGEVRGRSILLARADRATPELVRDLVARGAAVDDVVAYRTVEGPPPSREPLLRALDRGIDGILFSSGSTVWGMVRLLPPHLRQPARSRPTFCIGPVTARAARNAGFWVARVAREHTSNGLAAATAQHFDKEQA